MDVEIIHVQQINAALAKRCRQLERESAQKDRLIESMRAAIAELQQSCRDITASYEREREGVAYVHELHRLRLHEEAVTAERRQRHH